MLVPVKSPSFTVDGSTSFNSAGGICVPDRPGIYFIRDFRGVLYIGRTENLKRRFNQHLWNCSNPNIDKARKYPVGKTEFCWMLLEFGKQAEKEKELINYFQPPCNRTLSKKKRGVI